MTVEKNELFDNDRGVAGEEQWPCRGLRRKKINSFFWIWQFFQLPHLLRVGGLPVTLPPLHFRIFTFE